MRAPSDPPHSPLVFTDSVTAMDICRKMAVLFDAMDMQPQKGIFAKISPRHCVRRCAPICWTVKP